MSEAMETKIGKFTFKVVGDRFYTAQGVWALAQGNTIRVGLSDFLQQHSGDIAFVDIKPVGTVMASGDEVAVVETIKVTFNLTSPVSGTLRQVNPLIETAPETINQDPYGEGWLCEIEAADWAADQKNLLDPAAFFVLMKQEAEGEENSND